MLRIRVTYKKEKQMKTVWIAKKEDIIDHIVHSGADTYEWYSTLSVSVNGQISCKIGNETATFSATQAKDVVNTIIKEQKSGWVAVQDAVNSDDFDCNASDIVLQHIVLGELVFG